MPIISRETIDAVYEAARVEEVIGDYVQLKKAGSNFKGLSPFSDERTPSFMVSPVKQIWKDFSSGKGGDAIKFVMEHEHFTYPEAIRYLAQKYGIEIQETEQTNEQKEQASERESMYIVSEYANKYFQNQLHTTEPGKAIALTYFKERGFTSETIKKFQLGYSPDQWSAFTDSAIKEGYKLQYLEKTGLTIVKEEKQFDRFKGRVMFPIHSMSGRVLGFGGRILIDNKKAAKYLNSPESDIYHKSKVLYGIHYAKQAIAKEDNCYLVEGYTDVIQFHQTGVSNTVSSSGTALTPDQIRLINRLTKNITVLFDGDAAGMRAAIRGVDLILEQGMNVKVCTFPEGEDPDSFAKSNSAEALKEYLQVNSQDFIQFKASLLQKEAANDPIKKAELIRDMVASIGRIPDAIKREVYIRECATIMDISEEVLFSSLAQLLAQNQKKQTTNSKVLQQSSSGNEVKMTVHKQTSNQVNVQKVNELLVLERAIIGILLLYGDVDETFTEFEFQVEDGEQIRVEKQYGSKVFEKIYLDLQEDEVAFTNPRFQEIYNKIIIAYNTEDTFKLNVFMQQLAPELSSDITDILMQDEKYKLDDWERNEIYVKKKANNVAQYVQDVILNLRRNLVNLKIASLMSVFKDSNSEALSSNKLVSTQDLLEEVMLYQKLKRIISQQLNRVM